jgi:Fe-S cluster assembly protein SufD
MSDSAHAAAGPAPDWIDTAYEALAGDGLDDLRADALKRFRATGFPTTRHEAWKYTNLRKLARREFVRPPEAPTSVPDNLQALLVEGLSCVTALWADGRPLATVELPEGVDMSRLQSDTARPLIKARPEHPFEALNAALLEDVIHVRVEPGTTGSEPLYLALLDLAQVAAAAHTRIVVEVGANAELTLVEHYAGQAGGHFTNAIADIRLARGARMTHYRIMETPADAFHIGGVHVHQARDSHYVSHAVLSGGSIGRLDIGVELAEAGAQAELNGLYLAGGRQHLDVHTRVDHLAPDTYSREEYRGILTDRGRAVFNGRAIVHPDAQRIEAHQANHNLLLSDQAEVDTKPELEIYADDVKCSHGATVGQLDSDALFYLLSRGLDREAAMELLTFAFADTVLARMELPELRRHAEVRLAGRLPDSDRLREFL